MTKCWNYILTSYTPNLKKQGLMNLGLTSLDASCYEGTFGPWLFPWNSGWGGSSLTTVELAVDAVGARRCGVCATAIPNLVYIVHWLWRTSLHICCWQDQFSVILPGTRQSFQWYVFLPRKTTSTLWLFNIAMENGPFIDDLPNLPSYKPPFIVDSPWLCQP